MSKVKWKAVEYNPTENQQGSHSWYAEAVIDNEITNTELAERIARRTGFKTYECQAVVAAIADIVAEEVLESNRVVLADENGNNLVSLYPKVSGSVSDNDVQANPTKYAGATKATEEMVTDDMLTWTIGATVGIKFSKRFAIEKQAQKVKTVSADSDSDGGDTPTPTPTPDPGGDEG